VVYQTEGGKRGQLEKRGKLLLSKIQRIIESNGAPLVSLVSLNGERRGEKGAKLSLFPPNFLRSEAMLQVGHSDRDEMELYERGTKRRYPGSKVERLTNRGPFPESGTTLTGLRVVEPRVTGVKRGGEVRTRRKGLAQCSLSKW